MSRTTDRRTFLGELSAVTTVLATQGCASLLRSRRSPNFVFILVDDLGWRDLGSFGSTFYDTPNVDQLALSGMRFTDAYAACPVCSPTRASIVTGKYPARLNTTDWFGAPQPDTIERHSTRNKPLLPARYVDHLPLEEITIAEALKTAGYATCFLGKWHLGGEGYFPEAQGFDENVGGHHRGSPPGGYFSPYRNPKLTDGPEGEHLPLRLAEEASRFIRGHSDQPFLVYLSFYSVHTPLQAREDLQRKYEARAGAIPEPEGPRWIQEGERRCRQVQDHAVYGGMVEAMDEAVGMVTRTLEELGLTGDTIVLFMSDNGGLSTSEGHPTSNLPLRAGKGWLYEGGIREPMIICWPGVTRPGSACSVPVTSTDFYPTMLEMAGLGQMPEQHADGLSIVPLLRGRQRLDREAIFWHYPHYGNQGGSPGSAVRAGDWKLIEFYEDNSIELYNLRDDIGEKHDLSESNREKAAELRDMLREWRREVDARMPTPNH